MLVASGGDKKSAQLLDAIQKDEVTHVGSGLRWFRYICENAKPPLVIRCVGGKLANSVCVTRIY